MHFLLSMATLIAMAVERQRAEAGMHKLAVFAQLNPNPAMELSAEGAITYCNKAAINLAKSVGRNSPVQPSSTASLPFPRLGRPSPAGIFLLAA